jgi:hypothetical protein
VRSASAFGSGRDQSTGCTQSRVNVAGRLEDEVAIALVSDGKLDVITELSIEAVRAAQQQACAHAGATQHSYDV